MKYGNPKHFFNNEIDPNARRKEGMGLKKAQPGAPYGWTRTGEPYCGTQYEVDIDGKRWNSLSTARISRSHESSRRSGCAKKEAKCASASRSALSCTTKW